MGRKDFPEGGTLVLKSFKCGLKEAKDLYHSDVPNPLHILLYVTFTTILLSPFYRWRGQDIEKSSGFPSASHRRDLNQAVCL